MTTEYITLDVEVDRMRALLRTRTTNPVRSVYPTSTAVRNVNLAILTVPRTLLQELVWTPESPAGNLRQNSN